MITYKSDGDYKRKLKKLSMEDLLKEREELQLELRQARTQKAGHSQLIHMHKILISVIHKNNHKDKKKKSK